MKNLKNKPQVRFWGPDPDPAGLKPPEPKLEPKFTQADMDAVIQKRLGEEKKKFDQARQADLARIAELEPDSAKKAELEKQVQELESRYLSKEELLKKAAEKERAEAEGKFKAVADERDSWRKRYEDKMIDAELMGAASTKEADVKSLKQIQMLLRPNARLVPKVVDGKVSNEFETLIDWTVVGKDGKSEKKSYSPSELLKVLKDDPEYDNLFNAGIAGGRGGSGTKGAGGKKSLMDMSPEDFNKAYVQGTLPRS